MGLLTTQSPPVCKSSPRFDSSTQYFIPLLYTAIHIAGLALKSPNHSWLHQTPVEGSFLACWINHASSSLLVRQEGIVSSSRCSAREAIRVGGPWLDVSQSGSILYRQIFSNWFVFLLPVLNFICKIFNITINFIAIWSFQK